MYFWKYILAKKAGLSQMKCNMALYGLPVLPIAEAFEKTVTGNPITITDALAQDALSLQVAFEPSQDGTPSIDSEPTTEPYLSKVIPRGNKEYYGLVGATVAWNQLVDSNTTEVPTISERKYLTVISGTKTIITGDGTSIAVTGGTDNVHDLTQMFGSAIADYAYSLEQQTAGAGVQWLKDNGFFTEDYYAYNPGELMSVNTSGHKVGSTTYPIQSTDLRGLFKLSSANKLYCEGDIYPPSGDGTRKYGVVDLGTLPWNRTSVTSVFETTALQSVIKKSSSNYGVSVNYLTSKYLPTAYSIVNSGVVGLGISTVGTIHIYDSTYTTAEAFKAAMSGQYLVYELATPTTESTTPYTSPINIEAGGTEEFIDSRTVPIPVGNETYYASEYAVNGKTGVEVSHRATEDDPIATLYDVEFTQQGTIYGGTVDIVTGVLTVTWAVLNNPQNLHWITNSSQGMKNFQTDEGAVDKKEAYGTDYNWKCSRYSNGWSESDTEGIRIYNNGVVAIRDYRYWEHGGIPEEKAAFKASLADVTIAYELATPQVYNLTPQQVTMLLGNNYLETEDGTITITYMAGK